MCKNNVCILPLVVSIILGVVIGALFFAGVIAVGVIAVPLVIGIIFAALTLILLYVTVAFVIKKETKECLCGYGRCLALGSFITLVSAFLALTFLASLVAGGIISAILIGIFGFALILNFLSFVGLLVCLVRNNCFRKNLYCKFENDYNE